MAKIKITLGADPERPLAAIKVGRGSVLEADIFNVPEDLEAVQIHIGKVGEEGTFTAYSLIARSDERWYAYVNGLAFPDEGTSAYHITATDTKDGSHWLGEGKLVVRPSVISVEDTPIVPEDTYLRNPSTGLWHKLTVTVDDDGTLTPEISNEGITR